MRKLSELYSRREGPWFSRTDHLLEHLLRTQSVAAARNIPLIPFFRFLPQSSAYNEVLRETQTPEKQFANPVGAYIYINYGQKQKPLEKTLVDVKQEHEFSVDLAECIRLGELYSLQDPFLDFHFYLPRPNDVYQWDNSLFRIRELKPDSYYVLLQRYVVWKGEAELLRTDVANPLLPIRPIETLLETEHPVWHP